MIKVDSVSKRFSSIHALKDVSFSVEKGERVGFLGPNGAGKTTMMRILACFMPPTSGEVKIDGLDLQTDSLAVRRKIGYFIEKVSIYPDMRVREFLKFVAEVKGVPRNERKRLLSEAVDACSLGHVTNRIIGNLSKGYRQRVGLAQTLLNNPEILLLDEPTIGLDPEQVVEFRNLIRGLGGERTVILNTHVLPEVSQTCNKVIIIDKGRILATDTPETLRLRFEKSKEVRARIDAADDRVIEKLKSIPEVIRLEKGEAVSDSVCDYVIEAKKEVDIPKELCSLAFEHGWILREIEPQKMSLEDTFLNVVTREEL